jgi:3-hydroxyisobutyrate dehydrogenase-like beta-hydroxyacid dehydrogenase
MKQACAGIVEEAGGRYVEAAVMTPIAPKRIASAMLLGGPHGAAFLKRAQPLGFTGGQVFSDVVGQASATKMCRSVIIKGMEALLTESMVSARAYGVEKTVLDSLSDLLPVGDWDRLARYMISRALEHGTRRAEEMREAAQTVKEAGLAPLMAAATAERQDWAAAHRPALVHSGDLGAMLDAIRAAVTAPSAP